jgi:hypothetical protein
MASYNEFIMVSIPKRVLSVLELNLAGPSTIGQNWLTGSLLPIGNKNQ